MLFNHDEATHSTACQSVDTCVHRQLAFRPTSYKRSSSLPVFISITLHLLSSSLFLTLSVFISFCPYLYLLLSPPVFISIFDFTFIYILSIYLSIYLSFHPSIYLSMNLSSSLSLSLSLFVSISICLPLSLFDGQVTAGRRDVRRLDRQQCLSN